MSIVKMVKKVVEQSCQQLGLHIYLLICIILLQDVKADQHSNHGDHGNDDNDTGLCKKYVSRSFKCSEFKVETKDGYLLAIQKISSQDVDKSSAKGPAFLFHGLMQGGEIWVENKGNDSLALMMASAGYDVWIGNTRTTTYTYGHKSYSKKDKEYWNWRFDDLANIDLPTMLQFLHDKTKQPIAYVGYSQGTAAALAAFSQGKAINLLAKATLLCPVYTVNRVTSPLVTAASSLLFDQILLLAGVEEFNTHSDVGDQFLDIICSSLQVDCDGDLISQFTGPNCCIDKARLQDYSRHEVQPTAMKNLAQMAQMVRSGKFNMYDYGIFDNPPKYNSFAPPNYDVSRIPSSFPMFLVHGGKDALADPDDVKNLIKHLKGTPEVLYMPNYAHGDFVLGSTVGKDVYAQIIDFFQA